MTPRAPAVAALALATALASCATESPRAEPRPAAITQPTPAAPAPWYEPEIAAFEAADKAAPPPPGQVLFIGSSSIRLWTTLARDMSPAPVLNRGFGGSKTGEILVVFDRIVLPYQPRIIVYYCGDNDLGTDNTDSQSAADGFIEFDRRARAAWPAVRVLYIPIKPSLARWKNWPAMQRANDLVREYCARTPGAAYLDTVSPSLTPNGSPDPSIFREDGLHLNEKGYERWKAVVRPAVLAAWNEPRK